MSARTYRLKTDSGLSEELSLQALQQMVEAGDMDLQHDCTSDDGKTWTPLTQILPNSPKQSNDVLLLPNEASSLSANDTSVKASSDTIQEGVTKRRRLKRMSSSSPKPTIGKGAGERSKPKADDGKTNLDSLVGTTLPGDRYKVISQFGSGSMAYVFRASDNRLKTDVIIKVPKPEKITTDDFRERFKRESQLLVRLSHPHVVKVVDVGEFSNLPYVVMQLLSGGTLLDRIQKDSNELNQMSPDSLQTWVREVARALDFCFRKGMVHRDVKPANILFDDDDNAYVSDFGLTKIMHGEHTELCSDGTANGVVLGTPNYLPPEIILGAKYDGRADQYSLAMTVYHALCGRPPMQGTSATVTLINQTQKKLELLSSFRADVPRELALAVQKGIEKNPKDRFESCEALAVAVLDGLRSSQSSSSSTPNLQVPTNFGAGPLDSGEWHDSSSASSSRTRRSSSGTKGNKRRKSSSASSSSRMKSDWQTPASNKLPPKKKTAAQLRAARQKKEKSSQDTTAVFGQQVPTSVLAVAGIFVLLPTVIFLGYQVLGAGGSEESVAVAPAEWTPDEYSPNEESPTSNVSPTSEPFSSPGQRNVDQSKRNAAATRPLIDIGNNDSGTSMEGTGADAEDDTQRTKVAMLGSGNLLGMTSSSSDSADTTLTTPMLSEPDSSTASESDTASLQQPDRSSASKKRIVLASQPGAKVTSGPPGCPVVIVGNNVWSVANRRQNATLEGEYNPLAQTALSPDGRFFAAASKPPGQQNTDVIVWNTGDGRKLFTASGDSKRFVDTILLSSKSLMIGDRWSDEMLVWECESKKQKKSLKISNGKFKQGNTAISHNGEFLSAVAVNQLCVFKASDGKGVVKLAPPRAGSRKPDSAISMFASLQSLAFSPDNSELAAVSSVNGTKLICWNGRGEVILEHGLGSGWADSPNVQWFKDRNAWLLGPNVFDRESKQILLTALNGSERQASVQLYDDNHICGYFADNPDEVTLAEIPWDEIDSSVLVMSGDIDSHLSPGAEVSIVVDLSSKRGSIAESIRKELKSRLTAEGLEVLERQQTRFVVRITAETETFIPDRTRQLPKKERELPRYATATVPQLVVELFLPSQQQAVWSNSLGDASTLLNLADASETERKSRAEKIAQAIEKAAIPYYVPANEELIALPAVLW